MRKTAFILFLLFASSAIAQIHDETCAKGWELIRNERYLEASRLLDRHLAESQGEKHRLDILFMQGECRYMLDDYHALRSYIHSYHSLLTQAKPVLGDSLRHYCAYYLKMCGAYYYGLTTNEFDEHFGKAESSYEECLDSVSDNYSLRNKLYQEMAQLYYKVKDYDLARVYIEKVEDYYDMVDLLDEPERYSNLANLAMCYARLGKEEYDDNAAKDYFEKALDLLNDVIRFYKSQRTQTPSKYYEALRRKGKILMLQADRFSIDNTEAAAKCYREYIDYQTGVLSSELLRMDSSMREQRWLSVHNFLYDACRMGNTAPDMLYDLALFSKGFLIELAHNSSAPDIRWKQIRKQLEEKDCALEFVEYFGRNDEKRIGCLVLRKNSAVPRFVDIGSVETLQETGGEKGFNFNLALLTETPSLINAFYTDLGTSRAFWTDELMAAIGDAKDIYFAPDGLIHLVAIEYLLPDTSKVCHRLSSTRLLCQKRTRKPLGKALIMGGMDFDACTTPATEGNDAFTYWLFSTLNLKFPDLPATRRESKNIYSLRNNPGDALFIGSKATDEQFTSQLSEDYSIIHLSTHGYYGGTTNFGTDLRPANTDYSMSANALIFAGAQHTLSTADFDADKSDGILSAAEIARLKTLQGTDLVILSACQTGRGELTADGICGLQRALKEAGVKTMILSLWNIKDRATGVLMEYFHEELSKQKQPDIRNAFEAARRRMQEEPVVRPYFNPATMSLGKALFHFNTPYYINPFIVIDAL